MFLLERDSLRLFLKSFKLEVRSLKEGMKRAIGLVLIGAFLLRILVILMIPNHPLLGDEQVYLQRASEILEGRGFQDSSRPPLYAALLGGIAFVFGKKLIAIAAIQALLGTATLFFLYLLARNVLPERGALIAAILAAVFPDLVGYTLFVFNETLSLFLFSAVLCLLIKMHESSAKYPAPLGGLLFGLTALSKSSLFYFLPFILLFLFLSPFLSRKQLAARAFLFTASAVVAILPWTWHLYRITGSFILLDETPGLNLWVSNNTFPPPNWDFAEGGDFPKLKKALPSGARPRGKSLVEEYRNTLRFALENPGLFLARLPGKLSDFWSPNSMLLRYIPKGRKVPIYRQDVLYPFLLHAAFFIAFMGVSILGFLSMERNPLKKLFLLLLCYLTLVHLLFFGMSRFRFPLLPFLIIFAASALLSVKHALHRLDSRRIRLFLTITSLFLLLGITKIVQMITFTP